MYSVIETAGFQQKVALGQVIRIPSNVAEVGTEIDFKSVLLFSSENGTKVGTPVLEGSVKAEVLSHGRDEKKIVFKMKRRQGYRLKNGHRQGFTEVVITEMNVAGESAKVDSKVVEQAKKRTAAIAKAKEQNVPLTRKQKIAQAAEA
ncbi:MAG: 50S ribosomal protein L21 [Fibrobacterales bacterium]